MSVAENVYERVARAQGMINPKDLDDRITVLEGGEPGGDAPYYTKEEIDDFNADIDTRLDDLEIVDYRLAAPVTLTDAATINTNAALGTHFRITLGASGRTLANPTNLQPGHKLLYEIIQDGTGNRTAPTLGNKFQLAPDVDFTLSTSANVHDYMACIYNENTDKITVVSFVKGV